NVTRVTVLVALLCVTVLVASLLAYEAHDASRSERVTVERALHDYASVAAWELQSAARKRVDFAVQQALSPVATGTASSPYETLLPLTVVSSAARALLPCEAGGSDTGRTFVRLDLRDGSFATSGQEPDAADRAALIDVTRTFAQTRASPEQPYGLVRASRNGELAALVLGVKYATHGAPLAAFGFTVCPQALGVPLVRAVMATHPLLPTAVRGTMPNDSLVAVVLVDRDGRELLRTGSVTTPYAATVMLDSAMGIQATVGVQEAAATRLLVGRPSRSRVPVLVALLVLTAGLAAVALLQLRREHELARLRADFTSSVSHELRTPLAQILLFGETLSLGRTRDEGERRLAARTIVEEARRLMRIVDNILLFERVRRAPVVPSEELVDVVQLAEEVVRGFEPLAAVRGARIEVRHGQVAEMATRRVVRADASLIRQILLNLLDNAVKYGPEGQSIRVVVAADGDQLHLTVEDEGPGVPVADRSRVWEPYVRLRDSVRERGGSAEFGGRGSNGRNGERNGNGRSGGSGGSGLGLAVVRDLAESLGGRVWVDDGDRGGARFGLSLPLWNAETRPGAPPQFQSTPIGGTRSHHSNAPPVKSAPNGTATP
ncbi:MAG: HAMP domain-containing sensor histidine kinase, partial [Gemmatimonadaceae bacterium]